MTPGVAIRGQNGRPSISYLVSSVSGLGHVSRAVQVLNELEEDNRQSTSVELFADRSKHGFLRRALPRLNGNLHDIEYFGLTVDEIVERNHEALRVMNESQIIVSDWLYKAPILVDALRKNGRKGKPTHLVGLYHANLARRKDDDTRAEKFKQRQKNIVDKTDLYLHATAEPDGIYPTSTPVIPIPLIVRDSQESPIEVKRNLGLNANQTFAYVTLGGNGMGSMEEEHGGRKNYEYLLEAMDQIDPREIGVDRIVINTGGRDYQFSNSNVITIKSVPNGQDYVRAAEVMVGKPGMGTLAEAMKFGTPFVMAKWDLNEEEEEKIRIIKEYTDGKQPTIWGRSPDHILERVQLAMNRKAEISDKLTRVPTNGAEVAADILNILQDHDGEITYRLINELFELTPYKKSETGMFQNDITIEEKEQYRRVRREGIVETVVEALDPESDIIDIGCNTGINSRMMAEQGHYVSGVDIEERLIATAKKRAHENSRFDQGSAYDLRWDDEAFDGAVLTEILEHLDDPEQALEEAFRVTKMGGKVIIGVPRNQDVYWPGHVLFYSPESLTALVSKYSDQIEFKNTPGVNRHMHIVATKTKAPEEYQNQSTIYSHSLSEIRTMSEIELEDLAQDLLSVEMNGDEYHLKEQLMDYKIRTIAIEGRPIHRGTKVIHPETMSVEEVRALDRYDVIYGLATRIGLENRAMHNKHNLKAALVEYFN